MVDINFRAGENSIGRENVTIELMKKLTFLNLPLIHLKTFNQFFVKTYQNVLFINRTKLSRCLSIGRMSLIKNKVSCTNGFSNTPFFRSRSTSHTIETVLLWTLFCAVSKPWYPYRWMEHSRDTWSIQSLYQTRWYDGKYFIREQGKRSSNVYV